MTILSSRLGAALAVSALLISAPLLTTTAQAQTKVQAGQLVCSGGEGVGLILGSKKTYACRFTPTNGRHRERYEGVVTKVGLDVGITGKTTMVWTVLAASGTLAPGSLEGNYGGVAANVAVGVGGGANVLVGGMKDSITLQPLSVQGQTGVNLAVGIAGFSLHHR